MTLDEQRARCVEVGARVIAYRSMLPLSDAARVIAGDIYDKLEPIIRGHADATHICTDAIERARADEAKKWVRQVAEASQRVLDQRDELEARVMILRAQHRKTLNTLEAEIRAHIIAGLLELETDGDEGTMIDQDQAIAVTAGESGTHGR